MSNLHLNTARTGLTLNDLEAEVNGEEIFIRESRGHFRVTYKKLENAPELFLKSEWTSNCGGSALRLAAYRTRAWRLANDIALELGWF